MGLREVQKGSGFQIKGRYGMFGFKCLKAKMIMGDNNFDRTEIQEKSRRTAMILEVCYVEATVEEPYGY